MLRIKLIIAIAVLLALVFMLAALQFWGTQRAAYYYERSHLAHDAALAYLQLSHDAYRHFKELMDIVVLENSELHAKQAEQSYQTLTQSINHIRLATDAEIDFVAEGEVPEERMERVQITNIERVLNEGIWSFNHIMALQQRGADGRAQQELSAVLAQTIDLKFKPLIDAAIAKELDEDTKAQQLARELQADLEQLASMTAAAALLLSLIMAIWLWRSLSTPLYQLIMGVRRVARGDLQHRIQLPGRNEFTYLAKNFNEMTDELSAQRQQLLSAQQMLEQQVTLRTQELQQAYCRLQQIDKGRRRFFADISHELRTPLTALRGEAEVTLRGRDKPAEDYRATLSRVVELAGHMGKLVDDLLFMARSEATEFSYDLKPLVLNDFITDLSYDALALVHNRQQQLIIDTPRESVRAEADPQRLHQLLLILIDNACRYSSPGGKITLTLSQQSSYAILTVSDQGIGIDASELESVFERFYRSEKARSLVPSGSGLGLPLARCIAEAHNGKISLTSKTGEGTQVTFALPALS